MKIKVEVGDLILIPVKDNKYNVSKVIYLSKKYKYGMCIGIYDEFIDSSVIPSELNDGFVFILYTSTEGITNGKWEIIH